MKLVSIARSRSLPFIISTMLSLACANASANDANSVGIGATYNSGIYFGQDDYTEPYPFVDVSYGGFFIKDKVVGWTAYTRENISVALIAIQNEYFLDVNEIAEESKDIFVGISTRDRAIEAGFLYTYNSPVGAITWEYFKDVSDTYGGMHNIVRLARETGSPNGLTITPSIYVHYFTSAFNDYYFGVSGTENERGLAIVRNRAVNPRPNLTLIEFEEFRPEFEGQNSGHLGVDVWIKKPYTQNIVGTLYLGWEEVLGEVKNSPLVEDGARYTLRLGAEFRF